jgi:hypothetical protein
MALLETMWTHEDIYFGIIVAMTSHCGSISYFQFGFFSFFFCHKMCELTTVKLGWPTFNTTLNWLSLDPPSLEFYPSSKLFPNTIFQLAQEPPSLEFPSFDNLLPTWNSSLKAEFLHGGVLPSPLLDTLVIEEILLGLPITNPPCFGGFV